MAFIRAYIAVHDGTSPTYQEIADHLGVVRSCVAHILANLRARGFVTWGRRQQRSLTILDDGAPYSPATLAALSTPALEALRWEVANILYVRRIEAVVGHSTAPALEPRA